MTAQHPDQTLKRDTPPWRLYRWQEIEADDRTRILQRSAEATFDTELLRSVREIVDDVRANGDAAVLRALDRFDGCSLPPAELQVSAEELENAGHQLDEPLKRAIRYGLGNIRRFNERQLATHGWQAEIAPGILVGERLSPVDSVGLYIPSGKASYPSVLMQIGTPAVVAGVPQIAIVVPPMAEGGGAVDPAVLFVANELGLQRVYRANGVAGIAALAFGTQTFPKVRMVAGPGSPPITATQVLVQLYGVKTNMLLGPSESLIIADKHANADWIAADLLNEAEHGPDSASLLVTPSEQLVRDVERLIIGRMDALPEPRRGWAALSLTHFGGVILVDDLVEAAEVANEYAPEHMIVDVAEPQGLLPQLKNAGEILIGPWTPISAANYAIGVPAALPTGSYAKVSSGLTAHSFTKSSSIAELTASALRDVADAVLMLARHEGFPAHAASLEARLLSPEAESLV
jgi:histidinol dehydrogenase